MPHSHLPIEHLLKSLEATRQRPRDKRPAWLVEVVDEVCDLFDPYEDVARIGFECTAGEDRWELGMYVGRTEIVGGSQDGTSQVLPFRFDLQPLLDRFFPLDRCDWHVVAPQLESNERSHLLLEGLWAGEHALRLRIFSLPPTEAGPGLRQFADGRCEPT